MTKFKSIVKKTWVFATAAVLIAGSSSAMAFALSRNVPASASADVVPLTASITQDNQSQMDKTIDVPEYTVVDISKPDADLQKLIRKKLSLTDGITSEQIQEKYNAVIANMTPGEKDISAEQAASYAAAILKKVYDVDLTGYTAKASFSRNSVPNSDNWGVIFHAPNEDQNTKRYNVSVDSVNGTMLNAGFYTLDYTEDDNKDLESPEWKDKAVKEISKLIPENVSITNSKVVLAHPQGGVIVVCEISNGSAYAVRLTGEDKEAVDYIYFPNGYDGSLDYTPPTAPTDKAVG